MPYQRLLVAVDNDDTNQAVCEKAMKLATIGGGTVRLVHIVEPPVPITVPGGIGAVPIASEATDEEQEALINAAEAELSRLKTELGDMVIDCQVVESALARDTIHQIAQESQSDLIVVGNHGRHGIALFFSGSTTNELLKDAPCDILAVRVGQE